MRTSLCAATGKTVVASRTAESLIVFFTSFRLLVTSHLQRTMSAASDDRTSRTQSAQTNPIDNRLSPLLAPSIRILAHFYFPLSERMYLTKAIAASTSTPTISNQTRPIAIIMPPPIIPPSIIMHSILCFPLKPVWHGFAPDRAIDHSTEYTVGLRPSSTV